MSPMAITLGARSSRVVMAINHADRYAISQSGR